MTDEDRQTVLGIGGKLIESLRASPAILAIIVLNVILMAAIFWSIRQERQFQFELAKTDQQMMSEVVRLLAECRDGKGGG